MRGEDSVETVQPRLRLGFYEMRLKDAEPNSFEDLQG
jgi:hypothetical protein